MSPLRCVHQRAFNDLPENVGNIYIPVESLAAFHAAQKFNDSRSSDVSVVGC